LPVLASDVGSLKEEVLEGLTGHIVRPLHAEDLASKIQAYFASELFSQLPTRRREIQRYAREKYSLDAIATVTKDVYVRLLADKKV
jgi:glycosyltransferase involved in cell wall biosynthesis